MMQPTEIRFQLPAWVAGTADPAATYPTEESRIRLALALARQNVERGTGGPFGAAIFEHASGRLVGVGVNLVVPFNNCTLHAEMVAFMVAQKAAGAFTLSAPGLPEHDLYSSCEPCAMCLGAVLWSGVSRVVFSAVRDDALRLDFDEGPVFPESWAYLAERGITAVPGLLREEGQDVFRRYLELGGRIYNG